MVQPERRFVRLEDEVSKNQVVCARCHLARLASGMLCTCASASVSGAASARRCREPRRTVRRRSDQRDEGGHSRGTILPPVGSGARPNREPASGAGQCEASRRPDVAQVNWAGEVCATDELDRRVRVSHRPQPRPAVVREMSTATLRRAGRRPTIRAPRRRAPFVTRCLGYKRGATSSRPLVLRRHQIDAHRPAHSIGALAEAGGGCRRPTGRFPGRTGSTALDRTCSGCVGA